MKNKKNRIAAAIGGLMLCVSLSANAALESRLGGIAVYDTDLDITWLTDPTSGGLYTWEGANAWVEGLSVHGLKGWRLPISDNNCSGFNCINSEFGHLFYTEFGVSPGSDILSSNDPDKLLFSNLSYLNYWTGTLHDDNNAWVFNFRYGIQFWDSIRTPLLKFTTAVHSGDIITMIPEPTTYAMLLAGLGLMGFLRKDLVKL